MAENDKVYRIVMKRGAGVPTIPVSADHRNGDWLSTDIYEGETYQDTNTGLTYTRDGSSIVKVDGTPTKKVYKLQISQTGVSAPTEDSVFENDLNGVWSYNLVGRYIYTETGMFPLASKIFYTLQNNYTAPTSSELVRINNDSIELFVYNSAGALANDRLIGSSLLIEVYS